ncbi:hypothetical protein B0J14DRAFT_558451 [Halenospora varia]|nr:hypothetical protein B0J14DRAFT_558451 [Halenospora varia]
MAFEGVNGVCLSGALHLALDPNGKPVCIDTIRALIQNGTDVKEVSPANGTPMDIAVNNGSEEAVRVLIELGAHMTQRNFHNALRTMNIRVVHDLMSAQFDKEHADS